MTIQKGKTEYTAKRTLKGWTLTRYIGGVKVNYQIPKEVAADEEELRKFVMDDNELFKEA